MSAWFRRTRTSPRAGDVPADHPVRRRWLIAAAVAGGLAFGLGAFTFVYARGASYLMNDPEACGNCHIMREHLSAWVKSSHHAVATCNDCHTPHHIIGKYAVKAQNGFWHSFYFTTGRFPDPLRITGGNREVTEGACRYCHGDIVEAIDPASRHASTTHRRRDGNDPGPREVRVAMAAVVPQAATRSSEDGPVTARTSGLADMSGAPGTDAEQLSCIRCHRYVGHLVR